MNRWRYFAIAIIYTTLSLIIGEVHPFTTVPMYSHFPNWAYSFYLSNQQGRVIPYGHYFAFADDELSHRYFALCQQLHIPADNRAETTAQRQQVGQQLFAQLKAARVKPLPAGTIRLHRVCYYLQADTIAKQDIVLYETVSGN